MSPQLVQSINILALPLIELSERIQEELEINPALEVLEEKNTLTLDDAIPRKNEEEESYFENTSDPGGGYDDEGADLKQKFMEGVLSKEETLQEHLLWQLRLHPLSPEEFETGELLINNLTSQGFYIEDPQSVVPERLRSYTESMIKTIQSFEPVGCCVKDSLESLIVQAALFSDPDDLSIVILREHTDLIERGKLQEIAKKTKTSREDVEEALEFIKTLNPYPGSNYSSNTATYVIPDLMLKMKDGEFILIMNDEEIPVLGINPFFDELLQDSESSPKKDVKQFVSGRIRDAKWFIQSIKHRNQTLLKTAKVIIELQRDFFLRGSKYLVPLTLKDVADEVSMDESTISRISTGKYIQTEWGIFELKYFFTNSITGSGSKGSRFSKTGVKTIIKEILETSPDKKLSDQQISDLLKEKGISLARRTVAKYRGELDISSSFRRS